MIECRDMSVGYGRRTVLGPLSFRAEAGRITVLLGKNGCGKTTLFRALSGVLKYSGSVRVDGLEVSALPSAARAGMIAVMPQMLRSPDITVRELVSFGRRPYTGITGVLSRHDRETVGAVLDKTGMTALADSKLPRISGGERQKAYFAMLLAQQAENILLDEPGAHLDAAYMSELCGFLREERSAGKTVLAVFHDINRAVDIADKIIVVAGGVVAFDGGCREFCESGVAPELFGLRRYVCASEDGGSVTVFR